MANTQAMSTSFKKELLTGTHVFGTDTIKLALYLDAANLNADTATYASTNEVSNSGSYVAGGQTVAFQIPSTTGATAFTGPVSLSTINWTTFTASGFSAALLYNSSKANRAIGVYTFSSQSITSGTFTVTFPNNVAGSAMINLA